MGGAVKSPAIVTWDGGRAGARCSFGGGDHTAPKQPAQSGTDASCPKAVVQRNSVKRPVLGRSGNHTISWICLLPAQKWTFNERLERDVRRQLRLLKGDLKELLLRVEGFHSCAQIVVRRPQ